MNRKMFKPVKNYEWFGHIWVAECGKMICEICLIEQEIYNLMGEDMKHECSCKCARIAYARWNMKNKMLAYNEKDEREKAGQLSLDI